MTRYSNAPRDSSGGAGAQPRSSRPNTRWRQSDEVERLVAIVCGAMRTNMHTLVRHDSPVATAVLDVVDHDDPVTLARVIEGVLADEPTRLLLKLNGLHDGGRKRTAR